MEISLYGIYLLSTCSGSNGRSGRPTCILTKNAAHTTSRFHFMILIICSTTMHSFAFAILTCVSTPISPIINYVYWLIIPGRPIITPRWSGYKPTIFLRPNNDPLMGIRYADPKVVPVLCETFVRQLFIRLFFETLHLLLGEREFTMKICILIIAVMLSSTLVVGLSIHQPNYSTRQAQEVSNRAIQIFWFEQHQIVG